ncbi:hypothetical protein DACRYDRAFT_15919 [Dacryopinax primogenitus]|uniref:Uncharacterized protein n=1 Tax=Dacryopinax primogenitus (strain DJM 731) TaxID=1858805 RepID=M5GCT4_DACPD|nr:uncharacterized protein DACRYDRAFT_15919 [Dacryopinax primogenitus]EJU01958.1 hypothetical protein DACRYDRAFT_15919 [Dacryopinax primogenitus]
MPMASWDDKSLNNLQVRLNLLCGLHGKDASPINSFECKLDEEIILVRQKIESLRGWPVDPDGNPFPTQTSPTSSYLSTPPALPLGAPHSLPPLTPDSSPLTKRSSCAHYNSVSSVDKEDIENLKKHICELEKERPCHKKKKNLPLVTDLKDDKLDKSDLKLKKHLQDELQEFLYSKVGYVKDGIMPSKNGPQVEGTPKIPDFDKSLHYHDNVLICNSAVQLLMDQEEGPTAFCQEEFYCNCWIIVPVLNKLAHQAWWNMKAIYSKQEVAKIDGGVKEAALKRAGWQYEWCRNTGMLSQAEQEDPNLDIYKVCCPEWMNQKYWEWEKLLLHKKILRRETKHIDLG